LSKQTSREVITPRSLLLFNSFGEASSCGFQGGAARERQEKERRKCCY